MGMFGRLPGWFQDRGGVPPMTLQQDAPDPVRARGAAAIAQDNNRELERFDPLDDDKWPPAPPPVERERIIRAVVEQTPWTTIQADDQVYAEMRHVISRDESGFYVQAEDTAREALSDATGPFTTVADARDFAERDVATLQDAWAERVRGWDIEAKQWEAQEDPVIALAVSEWNTSAPGEEYREHIGQSEAGFHYALEVSRGGADQYEDGLPWSQAFDTREQAEAEMSERTWALVQGDDEHGL